MEQLQFLLQAHDTFRAVCDRDKQSVPTMVFGKLFGVYIYIRKLCEST